MLPRLACPPPAARPHARAAAAPPPRAPPAAAAVAAPDAAAAAGEALAAAGEALAEAILAGKPRERRQPRERPQPQGQPLEQWQQQRRWQPQQPSSERQLRVGMAPGHPQAGRPLRRHARQPLQPSHERAAAPAPQQPRWAPPPHRAPRAPAAAAAAGRAAGSTVRFSIGPDQDWSLPTGLAVTWLGTSSGNPTRERNISCTLVRVPGATYMVDCGEGSHRQARQTPLQLAEVEAIFITHLHGDHCFGLGGMLVSWCNALRSAGQQQRGQQGGQSQNDAIADGGLQLVGPPRLGGLVAVLLERAGVARRLDLPVCVTELVELQRDAHDWLPLPGCELGTAFLRRLAAEQLSPEDWPPGLHEQMRVPALEWQPRRFGPKQHSFRAQCGLVWNVPCKNARVTAAQLQHRVPCWGYVFDELQQQQGQQRGQVGGGRRVVVLGDTVDSRPIAPLAYGADLMSHEATFAAGMEGKAAMAQHSTAWMAGRFAGAVRAKALVLTHFSARYEGSAKASGLVEGRVQRRSLEAQAADERAEVEDCERAVKALQREAESEYGGQVLLAADLFTAHVPAAVAAGGGGGVA